MLWRRAIPSNSPLNGVVFAKFELTKLRRWKSATTSLSPNRHRNVGISITPRGTSGSLNKALTSGMNVASQGILYIPCSELCLVSESNRVSIRELGAAGTIETKLVSILELLVQM